MVLYYKKEHLKCANYSTSDRSIFKLYRCDKGTVLDRSFIDQSFMIFLLEGKLSIMCGQDRFEVGAGKAFLMPRHLDVKTFVEEDCIMVLCVFTTGLKLCSSLSLQALYGFIPKTNIRFRKFYSISLTDNLSLCLSSIILAMDSGLGCKHFQAMKREEIFIYLRAGYTKNQLAMFFYPVLGSNFDFKDFVLANYQDINDVAALAEATNMSVSTFNRRFKEAFGETAKTWLLARRSERIYADVMMTETTFAELAEKYSFSSAAYFSTFCKKTFGKTAQELRNEAFDK